MPNAQQQLQQYRPQELHDLARRIEQAGGFPDQEWTQVATSRDSNGFTVTFHSKNAVRFCAIGQLHCHAADACQGDTMVSSIEEVLPLNTRLAVWNDEPTRRPEQARRLFQEAAAKLYRKAVANAAIPVEMQTAAGTAASPAQLQPTTAAAPNR